MLCIFAQKNVLIVPPIQMVCKVLKDVLTVTWINMECFRGVT